MSTRERFAAGIVPVRWIDGAPRLLVLRAYRLWDFPKGEVEGDEVPLETALRELREESGLEGADFVWGREGCETAPYSQGKVARYYLAHCAEGEVSLPVSPELGRPEHHEFRWATPEEAASLLPARLQPILAWALERLADPAV